jgi:hypothetical protein
MLHRAKKKNPNAVVVAVGCYVQNGIEAVETDESIDLAIGNNRKKDLIRILEEYLERKEVSDAVIDIARKALMDILAGKTTLDAAIEKGVATAKGDFAKLDTLKDAIAPYKAPAKKAPAKKAPAKKAPAKKAPATKAPATKAEPAKKAEVKVETKKAEPKKVEAKKAEAKPAVKTTKKA